MAQTVIGKNQEAKEVNNHLVIIKANLCSCHNKLEARGETITAGMLKNEFTGVEEKQRILMQIIRQHNNDIKTLMGKDYSRATGVKYNTTQNTSPTF